VRGRPCASCGRSSPVLISLSALRFRMCRSAFGFEYVKTTSDRGSQDVTACDLTARSKSGGEKLPEPFGAVQPGLRKPKSDRTIVGAEGPGHAAL
jgi:hypothetical protein